MDSNQNNKITIPLSNGCKLVAEQNCNPEFDKEIMLYLVDKDGYIFQDLAIVRGHYDNGIVVDDSKFDVLVYGDPNNEDYTNSFVIDMYKEETN